MMTRALKANPRLERELRATPEFRAFMREEARRVKRAAVVAAAAHRGSGGYARRFVIAEHDGQVVVGNTDIAAHLIEYGSANNPPIAPLRRGVRAAGLDLKEDPK